MPFGKPVGHLRETVRNIREFWENCRTGEPMMFEGEWEPMKIRGYERPFPVTRSDIPVYLAAMGPLMTRLAGQIGDGWISHELCSPSYLQELALPDLEKGLERGGRRREDLDVVVSACCSISDDLDHARRRVAGLVGFYGSVRTYHDFFDFHGLAEDQQRVIDAFRSGTGADYLADAVSDRMVDDLTFVGSRDDVAARIEAYDGLADCLKLSPPTHGLAAQDTREAQDEIIALMSELTGARG